jgi:hypothetical protein
LYFRRNASGCGKHQEQGVTGEPAQPSGAQEAPPAQPQEGRPAQPSAQEATSSDNAPEAKSSELTPETARKLQSENRAMRRRVEELENAAKEAENAKLDETERLRRKVAEQEQALTAAQAERRELVTRSAVERAARQLNIVDEDAAYRLLDADAITYGEDGQPTNVDAALKKLISQRPFLVSQPPTPTPPAPVPVGATPRPSNGQQLSEAEQQRRHQAVYGRAKAAFG